ncbi:Phosphoinositide-binding clathrin adaptor, domain 2 [Sesbania bispinosa]|nr:Phosphoinositide-binding clathrin adaptor, domain 2 [Sesbania bispinosa]
MEKGHRALKDRYSIGLQKLSPCGPCRNPDLETVIIKATNHDEQCMDYKKRSKSFQWLRTIIVNIFALGGKEKGKNNGKEMEETLMEELQNLDKLQSLIDMLLQIKPRTQNMNVGLVLKPWIVVDEFEECMVGRGSKFCADVVKKAKMQGDKLSLYFDFCRDIGMVNASDYPKIVSIPEKDIQELQRIMNGATERKGLEGENGGVGNEDKAILVRDCSAIATVSEQMQSQNGLMTVITDQWQVFDDDIIVGVEQNTSNVISVTDKLTLLWNLIASYLTILFTIMFSPDLISL